MTSSIVVSLDRVMETFVFAMSEEEIPERSIPPITFVFSPNLSVSEIWIGEPLPIKLF